MDILTSIWLIKFLEDWLLSSGCVDLTGDEDPTDEDGDNEMGDPTGGSVSLCGVGRKAHLLEDKQIPSVGVFDEVFSFGKHLEEIHMTWAHLEKKQTRLQTYTNIAHTGDGVTNTT
ncbi:hypothetical protein Tco_0168924 [Tanacetum coccineum]